MEKWEWRFGNKDITAVGTLSGEAEDMFPALKVTLKSQKTGSIIYEETFSHAVQRVKALLRALALDRSTPPGVREFINKNGLI